MNAHERKTCYMCNAGLLQTRTVRCYVDTLDELVSAILIAVVLFEVLLAWLGQ